MENIKFNCKHKQSYIHGEAAAANTHATLLNKEYEMRRAAKSPSHPSMGHFPKEQRIKRRIKIRKM